MPKIPEKPWARRVLIGVDEYCIDKLEASREGAKLLVSDGVVLIPLPQPEPAPLVEKLLREGTLRQGAVLIQNPYEPDAYCAADEALQRFSVSKYTHFSHICGLLGAKSVTIKEVEIVSEGKTARVQVSADTVKGSGDLKVTSSELDALKSSLSLADRYEGGPPDPEAARRYMEQFGLGGDAVIASMVATAASPNRLLSRKLSLSLTSESRKNLELAARVTAVGALGLESNFLSDIKSQKELRVSIEVSF